MTKFEKLNKVFELLGLCKVENSFNNFYGINIIEVVEEKDLDFMLDYIPSHENGICMDMAAYEKNERLEKTMRDYHKGMAKAE